MDKKQIEIEKWLDKELSNEELTRRSGAILLILQDVELKLNALIKTIIENKIIPEREMKDNMDKLRKLNK